MSGGRHAFTIEQPDLDALVAFARGYLHQDFAEAYGDATGAARAFARDAAPDERVAVVRALDRIVAVAAGHVHERLATFFAREVRCAWVPAGLDEVRALAAAIRAMP